MKTKIMISALLCAFLINVNAEQSAEKIKANAKVDYATEFYHRGEQLSNDAVQASIGVNFDLGGVDLFAKHFTNFADANSELDTNILTTGLGAELLGLQVSAGVLYRDTETTATRTDVFISAAGELIVDLTGTIARDIDDDLYTYELLASYDIDVKIADLTIGGLIGSTDVTTSNTRDYAGVCGKLSKDLTDELDAHVKVAWIDADDSSDDTVVIAGIGYKF